MLVTYEQTSLLLATNPLGKFKVHLFGKGSTIPVEVVAVVCVGCGVERGNEKDES